MAVRVGAVAAGETPHKKPSATKALSATRARQLMGLPSGDAVFDYRDRAIIEVFVYSGARIGSACRLRVQDFHQDGHEATFTLHEKGDKHRRIGPDRFLLILQGKARAQYGAFRGDRQKTPIVIQDF